MFPSWACQKCGEQLGLLGRAYEWLFGTQHRCCFPHFYTQLNTKNDPPRHCLICGKRESMSADRESDEYDVFPEAEE
jgi:hypothetical protein